MIYLALIPIFVLNLYIGFHGNISCCNIFAAGVAFGVMLYSIIMEIYE